MNSIILSNLGLQEFDGSMLVPTWTEGRFAICGIHHKMMDLSRQIYNQLHTIANRSGLNIFLQNYQCSNPELDVAYTLSVFWNVWIKTDTSWDTFDLLVKQLIPSPHMFYSRKNLVVGCTFEPNHFYEISYSWKLSEKEIRNNGLPVGEECHEYWKELKQNNENLNYYNTLPRYK